MIEEEEGVGGRGSSAMSARFKEEAGAFADWAEAYGQMLEMPPEDRELFEKRVLALMTAAFERGEISALAKLAPPRTRLEPCLVCGTACDVTIVGRYCSVVCSTTRQFPLDGDADEL